MVQQPSGLLGGDEVVLQLHKLKPACVFHVAMCITAGGAADGRGLPAGAGLGRLHAGEPTCNPPASWHDSHVLI